ncbi:MAG TPA: hypothetical protein VGL60_09835 [Acidimicrobiales bacterium]|jgi:uncharacterized membrane protein
MPALKSEILLLAAVALATTVEMVEALTIVLAVGVTRGWRSALMGAGCSLLLLGGVVVAFGPAVVHIPLTGLRIAIGGLLLVFGVQWLRKAVLRASGYKALHDEDATYASERAAAVAAPGGGAATVDWYSFTVSLKGVFLEGLEVVFIVLTFGASQNRVALSAVTATVTALVVSTIGLVIRRPLSRIPENSLKFVVGILLTTFGVFWSSEGAGIRWPGSDGAIPVLLLVVAATSLLLAGALRHQRARLAATRTAP